MYQVNIYHNRDYPWNEIIADIMYHEKTDKAAVLKFLTIVCHLPMMQWRCNCCIRSLFLLFYFWSENEIYDLYKSYGIEGLFQHIWQFSFTTTVMKMTGSYSEHVMKTWSNNDIKPVGKTFSHDFTINYFCKICQCLLYLPIFDHRLLILSRKSILVPLKKSNLTTFTSIRHFSCSQPMCLYLVILKCKFFIYVFKFLHFKSSCVEWLI